MSFSMLESGSYLQLFQFFGIRVLVALLCGGMIGLERELKHKSAGMKTNMLICLGATLYTSISVLTAGSFSSQGHYGDPARLAAQIVSGIGFLGGGSIIQSKGTVQGLTTAATIWVVAALGVCIGIGYGEIAFLCTLAVIAVLVGTTVFEDRVLGRSSSFMCEIIAVDPQGGMGVLIQNALYKNNLKLDNFQVKVQGDLTLFKFYYRGHRSDHKNFILNVWSFEGIREVNQV